MNTTITHLIGAALPLLAAVGAPPTAMAQVDSEAILYSSQVTERRTGQTTHQIFSVQADGTDRKQLTAGPGTSWFPRLSPDGRFILFNRNGTLHVMERTGETAGGRVFAVGPAHNAGDWAPDGRTLVFGGTSAMGYGLWTVPIDPDREEVGAATLLRAGIHRDPVWSSDGKRIAYTYIPGTGGGSVNVLDLITRTESVGPQGGDPSWDPSGARLAFSRPGPVITGKGAKTTTTWYYEIFVMNADFSAITQVTALPANNYFPAWSFDGEEIAFRGGNDTYSLYKVTLATGAVTSLSKEGVVTVGWAP